MAESSLVKGFEKLFVSAASNTWRRFDRHMHCKRPQQSHLSMDEPAGLGDDCVQEGLGR